MAAYRGMTEGFDIPGEVWAAVIAVFGTLLVTAVTHHLTQRSAEKTAERQSEREALRFRTERLWEARKDAYMAILKHCRGWEVASRAMDAGYQGEQGTLAEAESFHASPERAKLAGKIAAGRKATFETFDLHRPIVSKAFAARLLAAADDLDALPYVLPPTDASDAAKIVVAVYADLLEIAEHDLNA